MEIPLVPEPMLLRRRGGMPRYGNVLDVVAADRNEPAHPLWPQRGDDAGGAPAPIIAGEVGVLDAERVHEVPEICPERGLLAGTRRLAVQKSGRAIAAQPWDQHMASLGRQFGDNPVPIMRVRRPAMQQDYRRPLGRPGFLVADLQCGGANGAEHPLILRNWLRASRGCPHAPGASAART